MLLAVGRKLELMWTEMLSELQEKVASIVEMKMDSRLCTQYCIALFCAEEVYFEWLAMPLHPSYTSNKNISKK